mgnify:CR=1 FL=1
MLLNLALEVTKKCIVVLKKAERVISDVEVLFLKKLSINVIDRNESRTDNLCLYF